ncbi:hypothetical protein ACFYO7_12675 [Nocardia salmonicida]|uniref:hypothetical protein n=1 Tax=Nocardia salmonicida TaxID=53431 RepID=UPI00369BCB27
MRCSQCGETKLYPGFLEDSGDSSRGDTRWVEGALQHGVFGGAKRFGRTRWNVEAFRCGNCDHLELFARPR